MGTQSQRQAVQNYRRRLNERGLSRFEVLARREDQPLIRSVAKRLSENDGEAARLREQLSGGEDTKPVPEKGGVLAALLRAPRTEDDELIVDREWVELRDLDL